MSLPTPVIAPVADIPAASLPTTAALDGSGSLPSSGGTTIVAWEWVLHDAPPGSTAFINNPTTATPTLANIDMVGSYLISLKVTDDDGAESFSGIEPVQASSAPYGFTFPAVGSMISVRVVTANAGLVKVAHGERAWLGRGLWELVDEIDTLRGDVDGILGGGFSGDLYTDNIYELTPANDIRVHHPVRIDTIKPRTGSTVNIQNSVTTPAVRNTSLVVQATTSTLLLQAQTNATLMGTAGFARVQAGGAGNFVQVVSYDHEATLEGKTEARVESASGDVALVSRNYGADGRVYAYGTVKLGNHRTQSQVGPLTDTFSTEKTLPWYPAGPPYPFKFGAGAFDTNGASGPLIDFAVYITANGTFPASPTQVDFKLRSAFNPHGDIPGVPELQTLCHYQLSVPGGVASAVPTVIRGQFQPTGSNAGVTAITEFVSGLGTPGTPIQFANFPLIGSGYLTTTTPLDFDVRIQCADDTIQFQIVSARFSLVQGC